MHVHGRPGQTCLQEAGLGGPQSQRGLWNSIVWGPGFAFRLSPGCLNPEVVLGYIGGAQCLQSKAHQNIGQYSSKYLLSVRGLCSILKNYYAIFKTYKIVYRIIQ